MGGADKGLLPLAGRPLAAWVLDRLAPQVDRLLVNANRNAAHYARLGHPVLADGLPPGTGPLAGVLAGLEAAPGLLLTAPCDAPLLPRDLAARLGAALAAHPRALAAVAHDGRRLQGLFALYRTGAAAALAGFLAAGGRRVEDWLEAAGAVAVDFRHAPRAFTNLNDPEALAALAAHWEALRG